MTADWAAQPPYPDADRPGPAPFVPGAPAPPRPAPAPSEPRPSPAPPAAASAAAPHTLLGPGLKSFQAKFVSSGVATRMRVDVHEGWLAITGVLLPRRWRKAVQIALYGAVLVIVVDLLLVRPLWSAALFAVLTAALLAFLVIVLVGERPARVVSLVVPLDQVSCAPPETTVESLGGRRKVVTLYGPFAGEWSANGAIKLVFASEADARGVTAALRPLTVPSYDRVPMR
jgi:hypothetical protein